MTTLTLDYLGPSLAAHAISLEAIHEVEVAWPRNEAMAVVHALCSRRVPILGGDVIASEGGRLRLVGESWHCDRSRDEGESEYLGRSVSAALDYIGSYPDGVWEKTLFLIVPR